MKQHKILVAEDDAPLLCSICLRLRSEGYAVVGARDGYAAVAMAVKHQPDLLILDVHMPAGDGFSVEERVRNLAELGQIPVVYITGDQSRKMVDEAGHRGTRTFLWKPFDTSALTSIVREALEPDEHSELFAALGPA